MLAERASEQARRAQAEYDRHIEAQREARRLADERRAEAERLAAEAAAEKERRRQEYEWRRAALRKPERDECRSASAVEDWPLFSSVIFSF